MNEEEEEKEERRRRDSRCDVGLFLLSFVRSFYACVLFSLFSRREGAAQCLPHLWSKHFQLVALALFYLLVLSQNPWLLPKCRSSRPLQRHGVYGVPAQKMEQMECVQAVCPLNRLLFKRRYWRCGEAVCCSGACRILPGRGFSQMSKLCRSSAGREAQETERNERRPEEKGGQSASVAASDGLGPLWVKTT